MNKTVDEERFMLPRMFGRRGESDQQSQPVESDLGQGVFFHHTNSDRGWDQTRFGVEMTSGSARSSLPAP